MAEILPRLSEKWAGNTGKAEIDKPYREGNKKTVDKAFHD